MFRDIHRPKWTPTTFNIPSTFPEISTPPINNKFKTPEEIFGTPNSVLFDSLNDNSSLFQTPRTYKSQISVLSNSSSEYRTPDNTFNKQDVFSENFLIQKSATIANVNIVVELRSQTQSSLLIENKNLINQERHSYDTKINKNIEINQGVSRSKSDFEIPKAMPTVKSESRLQNFLIQKSDSLLSFLTPLTKRRFQNHSTPNHQNVINNNNNGNFLIPTSPIPKRRFNLPEHKTTSLNSLKSGNVGDCQPGIMHSQR